MIACTPWNGTVGKALHFYGILPPNPLPEFGHWKTSDEHNLKDSLQAPWQELLKTVKGMKDIERSRISLRGGDWGDMGTKSTGSPGLDLGTEKEH